MSVYGHTSMHLHALDKQSVTFTMSVTISFQVRSKAVQTLNHSLSIPNRTTPFQLKELADILAFENESEVT